MMSGIRSVISVLCKAVPATATGTRFAWPVQQSLRFQLKHGATEIVVRGTTNDSNAGMDGKSRESAAKFALECHVRDVAARLLSRTFDVPLETFPDVSIKDTVEASPELTDMWQKVLQDTGYEQPLSHFISEADAMQTKAREREMNGFRTEVLRAELKELHDAGVADLLDDTMSLEAGIIRNYEELLKMLEEKEAAEE